MYNRAYYPNAEDIRVMVKKAIIAERNSQFNQVAVLHLLCEEKDKHQLNYFFHEYMTTVKEEQCNAASEGEHEHSADEEQ